MRIWLSVRCNLQNDGSAVKNFVLDKQVMPAGEDMRCPFGEDQSQLGSRSSKTPVSAFTDKRFSFGPGAFAIRLAKSCADDDWVWERRLIYEKRSLPSFRVCLCSETILRRLSALYTFRSSNCIPAEDLLNRTSIQHARYLTNLFITYQWMCLFRWLQSQPLSYGRHKCCIQGIGLVNKNKKTHGRFR